MNCPHCGKEIETKKSLRKRIEALEAELMQLRLQKTPITFPPIITPMPPQPEPYFPTWPHQPWSGGTISPVWPWDSVTYRAQN